MAFLFPNDNVCGHSVYVDAVVNHMSGRGGTGSANSTFRGGQLSYPAVPYDAEDFTPRSSCPSLSGAVTDGKDPQDVRNCRLYGMPDLNQGGTHRRFRCSSSDFAGKSHRSPVLISCLQHPNACARKSPNSSTSSSRSEWPDSGELFDNAKVVQLVAPFDSYRRFCFWRQWEPRIDAAKHMWPQDLKAIFDRLDDLPTSAGFASGARPFIYQEVISTCRYRPTMK